MEVQTKNRILAMLDQVNRYTNRFIDNNGRISKIEKDTLLGYMRDLYDNIIETVPASEIPIDEKQSPNSNNYEDELSQNKHKKVSNDDSEEFEQLKKNIESLKKQFEKMERGGQEEKEIESQRQEKEDEHSFSPSSMEDDQTDEYGKKQPQKTNEDKVPEKAPDQPKPPRSEQGADQEKTHKAPSPRSLGESFSEKKSSLNDKLSKSNGENTIGEQLKHYRVNDLKSAIDISHKFLFVNELFDGNAPEYHETIEQLNKAGSIQAALDILAEKRNKYNWDEKEGTFRVFNDLIHRKFQ